MYTEATVYLNKSDAWFWDIEPRILLVLLNERNKIERIKQKNLATYIACCVWGNDPNEADGKDMPEGEELVAGRDYPIDPARLRGL